MSSKRSSSLSSRLQCIVVLLVLLWCLICNNNNGICYACNHSDVNPEKEHSQQQTINEQMQNRTINMNSENGSNNNKYFKCQRSFELLSALPQLSKSTASDNCNFVYFSVLDASATMLPPTLHLSEESTILTRETGGSITEPNNKGNNFVKNKEKEKLYENKNDEEWRVQLNVTIELAPNIHELLASHVGSPEDYFLQSNSTSHQTQEDDAAKSSDKTKKLKTHNHNNNQNKKVHHQKSSQPILFEEDDPWRFSVSLQSKIDGSSIHYKGVSTNIQDNKPGGFSMCCVLFDVNHTNCPWMQPQWGDNEEYDQREEPDEYTSSLIRTIAQCQLPLTPSSNDVSIRHPSESVKKEGDTTSRRGIVLSGNIVKPLHRVITGPWEAKIQLWRRRANHFTQLQSPSSLADKHNNEIEMLGRIVIPFHVNDLSEIADHNNNSSIDGNNKIVATTHTFSDQEDLEMFAPRPY